MNKKLLFGYFVLIFTLLGCKKVEETRLVITYEQIGEATVVEGNYGDLVEEKNILPLVSLVDAVEASGSFTGKVSGKIKEVCTSKGCWFSMELPNGSSMRVTFKEYGFFIPTNSQGFPITIEGVATLTQTDVATLRHYAEDQGKTKEEVAAIQTPKREISFEAIGALIKSRS